MSLEFFKNISMNIHKKLISKIIKYFTNPYFGFINGHKEIDEGEISNLEKLVGRKDNKIISKFEKTFAEMIGNGKCISYASARMGFYEIMRQLKIKDKDEIIILGSTCSVMTNAIKRLGAIPIYSDIDLDTLGSDYESIKKLINIKTKIIIAQHSFGIPCNIEPILKIAKLNKIFLLEDCALSFDSSIGELKVGNFGDAAIFSTDHTKPINTIIGGMVYTKNNNFFTNLKLSKKHIKEISYKKQNALWLQFLNERKKRNPKNTGKIFITSFIENIKKKYFGKVEPFLTDDYSLSFKSSYPYPSNMPTFIAAIGIIELKKWHKNKKLRTKYLMHLIKLFQKYQIKIPNSYFNENLKIVPLRFVWLNESKYLTIKKMDRFIDTSSFWFKKPIIATEISLLKFNYIKGMCPKSEFMSEKICNIPCNLNEKDFLKLLNKLEMILEKSYNG